jgi:hypothetical protein
MAIITSADAYFEWDYNFLLDHSFLLGNVEDSLKEPQPTQQHEEETTPPA